MIARSVANRETSARNGGGNPVVSLCSLKFIKGGEKMNYGCIYIIKNTVNNKVYIGQTTLSVKERFGQHMKPYAHKKKYKISRSVLAVMIKDYKENSIDYLGRE